MLLCLDLRCGNTVKEDVERAKLESAQSRQNSGSEIQFTRCKVLTTISQRCCQMSGATLEDSESIAKTQEIPALPPNVTIFSPSSAQHVQTLLASTLFTRLSLTAATTQAQLSKLSNDKRLDARICLLTRDDRNVLIFDADTESEDTQDKHHDHFREVCLALKDHDIGLNVASCIHDATTALKAGFQFDKLNDTSVLVIDLMATNGDGDSEDDSDSEGELQMMTVDGDVSTSDSRKQ